MFPTHTYFIPNDRKNVAWLILYDTNLSQCYEIIYKNWSSTKFRVHEFVGQAATPLETHPQDQSGQELNRSIFRLVGRSIKIICIYLASLSQACRTITSRGFIASSSLSYRSARRTVTGAENTKQFIWLQLNIIDEKMNQKHHFTGLYNEIFIHLANEQPVLICSSGTGSSTVVITGILKNCKVLRSSEENEEWVFLMTSTIRWQ